jgi:PQQ-like domain
LLLASLVLGACSSGSGSGSGSTPPPTSDAPSVTLGATPSTVAAGGTSTLTWSTSNANACTASAGWSGSRATSGSASTGAVAATTSYTLTCTGATGTTPASATAVVTVSASAPAPAPTVVLTANPTGVAPGGSSTLTWSSSNASTCTASAGWSGSKATSGSASTGALNATTSYTLTCSGATGTTPASATATVAVMSTPTVTLKANPAGVASGGTSTLSWSSTNAASCTASDGWDGTKATSGSTSTGSLTASSAFALTCYGAGGSSAASATVSITNANGFSVSPRYAALTLSQSQQFTATVPGGGAAAWKVDGIAGGNTTVGTIRSNGVYVPPSTAGTHTVLGTSVANPAQSASASVAVTDLGGVYTYHNDLARTGQNLQEYALTPAAVSGGNFGKRWTCSVDGDVHAQPLYVANLAIAGSVHNVLLVATENDSVYAFDADDPGCSTYWHLSTLSSGVTTIPAASIPGSCNFFPNGMGITGSPVIDSATQTLYFVAATLESGSYYQRLHAINIATGAERSGSPVAIQASVATHAGGTVSFSVLYENQRPALALYGGGVFIGWASNCDVGDYWGWLMRYDATSLAQTAVFNVTPNAYQGGIWMSGGAPAVDSEGRLFLSTGNGAFDNTHAVLPAVAPDDDFSMSFLNLNPSTLAVQDFYTPSMEAVWSGKDLDISSSGVTVLPDGIGPSAHPDLLVGSDKQSHLWLMDRSNMSKYSATADNTVQYLTLPDSSDCSPHSCMFSTPAYYGGTLFFGVASAPLIALPLTNGLFSGSAQGIADASSVSPETYGFPGPTPMISASPSGNAVVWALDTSAHQSGSNAAGPAILRAYDAGGLATELYSSSKLAADTAGGAVSYTLPVIANGRVYIGGARLVTVYGLAP